MKKEILHTLKKCENSCFSREEIEKNLSRFGEIEIIPLTFGRWEIFVNGKSAATIEEDDGIIVFIY